MRNRPRPAQPATLAAERRLHARFISPDLMADGAFGKFTLTIRIPPPAKAH